MNDIKIKVDTHYIEKESVPEKDQYIFSYTITIQNLGSQQAKLLRRHWIITDDKGKVQEVEGEGVIGEQPTIHPGDQFQYTSGTILTSSIGTMKGSYQMIDAEGNLFQVEIPEFLLTIPRTIH